MTEEKEGAGDESVISIEGLLGLFGRNTRLVAALTALGVGASVLALALQAPVFRAKATLILDDRDTAGGLLGELASLGKAPQAASEIEILRARTTAERVAADATAAGDERHLGLTTLVEDPRLAPLARGAAAALRAGAPHLRARVECANEGEGIERWSVEFTAADRVRIARAGLLSGGDALEASLSTQPIEHDGARFWLSPQGDLTGASFTLAHLTEEEAVRHVLAATRVRETERNSGVIELLFDDSDPRRAAAIANALCRNYLDRNEQRGERKASQTLEFIRTQLAAQSEQLQAAERDVVALQQQNPRAINIAKSSEALIAEASTLEVRRIETELARVSLRQALDLLAAGDVEALSRLTAELADPITATYVEGLATLSGEYELQERSDAGAYKALLQEHALQLETRRDQLALEIESLAAVLDSLGRDDWSAVARLGGGPPAARDALLEGYLEDLARLESQAADLRREFTPEHPENLRVEHNITATRTRIAELLRTRCDGLRAQKDEHDALLASYLGRAEAYPERERARIAAAQARLRTRTAAHLESRLHGLEAAAAATQGAIAEVETDLGRLPEEERRLADPLRRMTAHSEIVKFLLARQQESEIARAATIASADFIDPASAPTRRHAPSIALHVVAGLLLGLVGSLLAAFAKEALSRGVFTAAELESATSLPVFGSIPDFRHGRFRRRGVTENFVPMRDDPEGPVAEAYRSLRANLKFALSGEREIRTLAITSCTQGEGKSLTNIDLAVSFARTGKRVLIVDSDMRCPSVHSYLGLELSPGLADVLEQRVAWRECLRTDVEPNLDVLSAGAQPRNPSDLLDSRAFEALLGELRESYDLIMVDVPPALAVSDIESIAARLDAILLLCKSNKVSAEVVGSAARRLKQVGANLIGAVLNAVGTSLVNRRYGYGYGYGYGYSRRSLASSRNGVAN